MAGKYEEEASEALWSQEGFSIGRVKFKNKQNLHLPVVAEALELNGQDGGQTFDTHAFTHGHLLVALVAVIGVVTLKQVALHVLLKRLAEAHVIVDVDTHGQEGLLALVPGKIQNKLN